MFERMTDEDEVQPGDCAEIILSKQLNKLEKRVERLEDKAEED